MNRLAFSGKMVSGKTVSAMYFVDNYGFERIRFADPIHELAEEFIKVYRTGKTGSFHSNISKIVSRIFPRESKQYSIAMDNLVMDLYEEFLPVGSTIQFKDPNYRSILQKIGTEKMRSICSTVWVDFLKARILANPTTSFVVDDVRFPDELAMLVANGFIIVRLEVSPAVQQQRILSLYGSFDPEVLQHPSEVLLDNAAFDTYIDADAAMESMFHQIENELKWRTDL